MKKTIIIFAGLLLALSAIIDPVIDNQGYKYGGRAVWSLTLTNATSDWIRIPENTEMTTVSLALASNQARVEYTTVPYPHLTNTAHIFIWPYGNVTNDSVDVLIADAIALRVVSLTNVTRAFFVFKRRLP